MADAGRSYCMCGLRHDAWSAEGRRTSTRRAGKENETAYPDIVSRLSLYMGAGISSRKAWERIAAGYRNRTSGPVDEAYEEMCTTLYEMQNGVPESIAYEKFGGQMQTAVVSQTGGASEPESQKGHQESFRSS